MDGCGIYSSFYWYHNLYETTRSGWVMAIFLKGTQNGQFWPKCKGGTLCKNLKIGHFLGPTLKGCKIINTSLISMDGCGIYSSFYWYHNLYETTRSGWVMAIFLKGTQNGQFWPKCKGGTLCKNLKIGHFLGPTLKGCKIINTSRILA